MNLFAKDPALAMQSPNQNRRGRRAARIASAAVISLVLSSTAMPSLSAPFAHERYDDAQGGGPTTTVEHGAIEVGFSPRDGGETLVLKVIDSARSEIRLMAYSFTSAPIVTALLNARRRGVNVALIVDAKENLQEDRSGRARHALSALVNAGCSVRTISIYPIMHDKIILADRRTVETGSYNYSDAAANKNSENVLVIWNSPDLAKVYSQHWKDRFDNGQDFQPNY